MKIQPFAVEEWMNAYETKAKYNIAETCCDSISLDELFKLSGTDKEQFLSQLCSRRLTYGDIEGLTAFKDQAAKLYRTMQGSDLLTFHGAAGANHHVFYSLVDPGDTIISVMPTYQQLYSIPEAYRANVKILHLQPENGWLPDLDELRHLASGGARMICINNPNNPTGALMNSAYLQEIVDIARKADAYLLCDEVYRHLTQSDEWSESIADLYEKGISISSMSKVFSLAGLRLGWAATHDETAMHEMLSHRDYNHISCGMLDESFAALAMSSRDALLTRNRNLVRKNLSILDTWVQQEPHIRYIKPQAGTTALLHVDLPDNSYDFCRSLLMETGTLLTPGDCFGIPHSMRIGYACDEETLRNGLRALSDFLNQR